MSVCIFGGMVGKGFESTERKSNHEEEDNILPSKHRLALGKQEIRTYFHPDRLHSHSSLLTKTHGSTAVIYLKPLVVSNFQTWLISLTYLIRYNLGSQSPIQGPIPWFWRELHESHCSKPCLIPKHVDFSLVFCWGGSRLRRRELFSAGPRFLLHLCRKEKAVWSPSQVENNKVSNKNMSHLSHNCYKAL